MATGDLRRVCCGRHYVEKDLPVPGTRERREARHEPSQASQAPVVECLVSWFDLYLSWNIFPSSLSPLTTPTTMPPPPFSTTTPDDFPHRPPTARPTTAAGSMPDYDFPHGQNPHHYPAEYQIEEYEEESDDEDVFAFLPPSTAEQQQQQNNQRQHHDHDSSIFANYPPPTPASQQLDNVAFPAPTYNPYGQGKYPYDDSSVAAASSSSHQFGFDPSYGYPNTHNSTSLAAQSTDGYKNIPGQATSNYTLHPPPQSPPSTDSHNQNNDDPYRMKRLNTALSSAVHPSTADLYPSQQVHVPLPSSVAGVEHAADAVEKATVGSDVDLESLPHQPHQHGHQGRIRHGNLNSAPYSHGRSIRGHTAGTTAASGVDTISVGPSILDDDVDGTSREGSIK